MNKLAQYLNQHLIGEVVVDHAILQRFSKDNSPLAIQPEMVAYPRNTNDIRKLLRFSAQLAQKGHNLSVTARGSGMDSTGGAIGTGLSVSISTHMDKVLELDPKQRLVRLQAGATVASLQDSLAIQGLRVGALAAMNRSATLGGVIASARDDSRGESWVDQMEIVLSNGDLLQTKRLSKRELNKKKGEQSFEADIYRAVDSLIDDNKELVDGLDETNVAGYSTLRQVKRKDGSINLAPLFFASQGSLGIVSEMIVKAEIAGDGETVVVAAFNDSAKARDAIDDIEKIGVASLEYYDDAMLDSARSSGKTFSFMDAAAAAPKVALVMVLDDASSRMQAKKVKKLTKLFTRFDASVHSTNELAESELASVISLPTLALQSPSGEATTLPIIDGIYVPLARFEDFANGVAQLAEKRRIALPIYGRPLEGIWYIRPTLNLHSVGGKQAVFKLIDDFSQLTAQHGGHLAGQYGEGRLQAHSTHKMFDEKVQQVYADLKTIFDPNGILNVGVKQPGELRDVVGSLRSEYGASQNDGLARF